MQNTMTDYQFKTLLNLVLMAMENSSSLEEAIQKVKALSAKEGNEN
ncbi:MAG: hypothetical protein FWD25_02330 [Clostridia bacterium]|nr:hypothetical protein [Clostridia bacterium]